MQCWGWVITTHSLLYCLTFFESKWIRCGVAWYSAVAIWWSFKYFYKHEELFAPIIYTCWVNCWHLFKSMRRFLHPLSSLVTRLWYSLMGIDDLLWGWRRICCIWHMSVFSDILRIISPVGSLENLGLSNVHKRFIMCMKGLKYLSWTSGKPLTVLD